MGKLFCIMGKSASGKDTIFKKLVGNGKLALKKVVPYTTRPPRTGEVNGKDYYFVSNDEYEAMKDYGQIIERRTYETIQGPWHYFTADDGQIDLKNGCFVMVGTLEVYTQIRQFLGENQVIPIYIEVEDGERLSRAIAREREQKIPNYEEVCRRFLADAKDFSKEKLEAANIEHHYINTDLEKCYKDICEDMMKYCTLNE